MRRTLLTLSTLAVVGDAVLLPFYPQYFASRFGVEDARLVGNYLAALCLVVMLALPLWARLARRVELLRLLPFTQLAAALLCVACYAADSMLLFWLASLAMVGCKSSYLLIYPRLMSQAAPQEHAGLIGLLSVIVHFGGIAGALLGGVLLGLLPARHAFLLMALADLAQMGLCLWLLRVPLPALPQVAAPASTVGEHPPQAAGGLWRLGLLMLLFYCSAYLVRGFFALYWQQQSGLDNSTLAAAVFALPALLALLGLWHNRRRQRLARPAAGSTRSLLLLGAGGLLLQALPQLPLLLLGRCLFGWALFQLTVRLDLQLFRLSTPLHYARDYSRINLCQNLGVLLSSSAAGALVASYGLVAPFVAAALGLLLCLLAHPLLLPELRPPFPKEFADEHA
ncbi:MFS transporter [Aquitalea magnusonii]|uniref:Putative MFS family arabinose efflux permease n=1 Tax=Aquitalea magnusonii TaxID=332411 RepID=A0A318J534_9NEIS|nr:MFS transporter [Aquitalea magnusonii]PXX41811.1 putative MFS family arabinose efflux permease [Aquitalea magnusonii]